MSVEKNSPRKHNMIIEKGWFWKSLKEKGLKPTWKQLVYNYEMLYTPRVQMRNELVGQGLMVLACLFAAVFLYLKGLWYLVFIFLVQAGLALNQALIQLKNLRTLQFFENQEERKDEK